MSTAVLVDALKRPLVITKDGIYIHTQEVFACYHVAQARAVSVTTAGRATSYAVFFLLTMLNSLYVNASRALSLLNTHWSILELGLPSLDSHCFL